jgi:surface antigen
VDAIFIVCLARQRNRLSGNRIFCARVVLLYYFGYCFFAYRRGDAHDWDTGARAASYIVDHKPAVGAIMQTDAGELGHVAYVEKVNPDGSWEVSEMNVKGWDILSSRTFKAEQAKVYNFIH